MVGSCFGLVFFVFIQVLMFFTYFVLHFLILHTFIYAEAEFSPQKLTHHLEFTGICYRIIVWRRALISKLSRECDPAYRESFYKTIEGLSHCLRSFPALKCITASCIGRNPCRGQQNGRLPSTVRTTYI